MVTVSYLRVSTGRQAERDLSIPDQSRQAKIWCEQRGHTILREYIEPGASATNDRRPVFQEMVNDVCADGSTVEAIIVHSYSRFFRDYLEIALYERTLERCGVKLISITQETSDDFNGVMVKRLINMFDEFSSKENSKHTLRAMQESARQGFFNGSRPPFGYRTEEVEGSRQGHRGQNKKRLVIDESEAETLKLIFTLSIQGLEGIPFGIKQITNHLNKNGILKRDKPWSKATIGEILQNSTYFGEHYFNKRTNKNATVNPKEEWIKIDVPGIISKETFEESAKKRAERSPKVIAPRLVSSSTLLTGMLKCSCGASMTLATGKGGQYRYYKCTSRINKSNDTCKSLNLPMEHLDEMVLARLADKVFTAERVLEIVNQCQRNLQESVCDEKRLLEKLRREESDLEGAMNRLLKIIEGGIVEIDDTFENRIKTNQDRRKAIKAEITNLKRQVEIAALDITPEIIERFCLALREKLRDKGSKFGKAYLKLLIEEIRVEGKHIRIIGRNVVLMEMLKKKWTSVKECPLLV